MVIHEGHLLNTHCFTQLPSQSGVIVGEQEHLNLLSLRYFHRNSPDNLFAPLHLSNV